MANPPARLGDLALAVPGARLLGNGDIRVARVSFDSRQVTTGDLFVALPGTVEDGLRYVGDALRRGAVAVVVENGAAIPAGRSGIVVPSARRALGLMSAALNDWPSRSLRVTGVTGTDGKTTTTTMISSILRAAARHVGVVTTVRAEIGDDLVDTGFHTTTPDAPDLQRYLRRMVESGAEDAVLEVTSHGLAQERVAGCDFDVAVITNVTGDHLDFHESFEAYLDAKLRLFRGLDRAWQKPGIPTGAVYNLDDISAEPISAMRFDRRLSYSLDRPADVRPRGVAFGRGSTRFDVETPREAFPVEMPFVGWYNVANALAAIAAGLILDVPTPDIQRGIAEVPTIPGRLEPMNAGGPFEVFVDFAHTANSLERVLALARERCRRKLSLVFGCAGRRDATKREPMGEIAGRYADRIYLTAEDPRTESLDAILESIAAGCCKSNRREGVDFWRVPDRGDAIARAIAEADEGDLVLITGKGHEQSMCFGTTEIPWSDAAAAHAALAQRFGR
jgi:UDP-N-acetylmuramoyl-L-alanyl-D-glutamate--2,6-diaminopimelate ligase